MGSVKDKETEQAQIMLSLIVLFGALVLVDALAVMLVLAFSVVFA